MKVGGHRPPFWTLLPVVKFLGSYPTRPKPRDNLDANGPLFIAGNEALAEIEEVGEDGRGLAPGDWVIMGEPQQGPHVEPFSCARRSLLMLSQGTWASRAVVSASALVKVARSKPSKGRKALTEEAAATLTVNPASAYRLLKDFVDLDRFDWIIQNGANSAVGTAIISICREWGINSINVIRDKPAFVGTSFSFLIILTISFREELDEIRARLTELGATHVITTSELAAKSIRGQVAEWTKKKPIRLGLNCVGGPSTTDLARLLGMDATIGKFESV